MQSSVALFAAIFALGSVCSGAPLTQHDRERMLSELHASRKMFLDSVAGLSQAQWTFKAAPDRWSIQQVAEHIAVSDGFFYDLITKQIISSPADAAKAESRKSQNAVMDEKVIARFTDRSHKFTAPEPIAPKGKFATVDETVAAFKAAREKTLDYVRTTNDDLREHFMKHPSGMDMDAVQWMLGMAGHTERHVAQILEVKQSPGYPKN